MTLFEQAVKTYGAESRVRKAVEELTELSVALEKELDDMKKQATDEGNILIYKEGYANGYFGIITFRGYKGKDKVIKELTESIKEADKKNERLDEEVTEYKQAGFLSRLYYLFLGRLPGMK